MATQPRKTRRTFRLVKERETKRYGVYVDQDDFITGRIYIPKDEYDMPNLATITFEARDK